MLKESESYAGGVRHHTGGVQKLRWRSPTNYAGRSPKTVLIESEHHAFGVRNYAGGVLNYAGGVKNYAGGVRKTTCTLAESEKLRWCSPKNYAGNIRKLRWRNTVTFHT